MNYCHNSKWFGSFYQEKVFLTCSSFFRLTQIHFYFKFIIVIVVELHFYKAGSTLKRLFWEICLIL